MDHSNSSSPDTNNDGINDQNTAQPVTGQPSVTAQAPVAAPDNGNSVPVQTANPEPAAPSSEVPPSPVPATPASESPTAPDTTAAPAPAAAAPTPHKSKHVLLIGLVSVIVLVLAAAAYFAFTA